ISRVRVDRAKEMRPLIADIRYGGDGTPAEIALNGQIPLLVVPQREIFLNARRRHKRAAGQAIWRIPRPRREGVLDRLRITERTRERRIHGHGLQKILDRIARVEDSIPAAQHRLVSSLPGKAESRTPVTEPGIEQPPRVESGLLIA